MSWYDYFGGLGLGIWPADALQNAYPFPAQTTPYEARLQAAKMALKHPDRVERLENGLGWRIKPTAQQAQLAELMMQSLRRAS